MMRTLKEEIAFWRQVDGAIDFVCAVIIMAGGAALVLSIL